MTKKALTLALEALEKERPYLGAMPALTSKAITAIKEALSELEQDDEVLGFNGWGFPIEKPSQPEQEPVACPECKRLEDELEHANIKATVWKSAYDVEVGCNEQNTTPPQRTWVGLTNTDWDEIKKQVSYNFEMTTGEYAERVSHLVEEKLMELNT